MKSFFLDELALAIEQEGIGQWFLTARVLPWVTGELLGFITERDDLNAAEVKKKGLKEDLWFNCGHLDDRRVAQILPYCCGRDHPSALPPSPETPSRASSAPSENPIVVFPSLLRFHIDLSGVVAFFLQPFPGPSAL